MLDLHTLDLQALGTTALNVISAHLNSRLFLEDVHSQAQHTQQAPWSPGSTAQQRWGLDSSREEEGRCCCRRAGRGLPPEHQPCHFSFGCGSLDVHQAPPSNCPRSDSLSAPCRFSSAQSWRGLLRGRAGGICRVTLASSCPRAASSCFHLCVTSCTHSLTHTDLTFVTSSWILALIL